MPPESPADVSAEKQVEPKDISVMTATELESHIEKLNADFKAGIDRQRTSHRLSQKELTQLLVIRKRREAAATA